MPFWKTLLLNMYYHGSYPYRAWHRSRLSAAGRAPVVLLFYHRIADDHPNGWTARFDLFQRQVRWLGRHFELVSLGEAQNRVRQPSNRVPSVAITFDDGYADNCQQALPWLIENGIPCTYFISTHYIRDGEPFPHDVARGCPLAPNTPRQIRDLAEAGVEIGAHTRTHPDLGKITDPDRLYEEIVGCREDVEQITGKRARYFAFPTGQHQNMSPLAFQIAKDAGYEAVCSAYGGFNYPGDDPFHLQRVHGDDDMIRLKNWLSGDPRKERSIVRYDYRPGESLPLELSGGCR